MKDTVKRMKNKPQTERKYLQKTHLIRDLLCKIYKEHLKVNNKKNKQLNYKMNQKYEDTSPKKERANNHMKRCF